LKFVLFEDLSTR